MEPPPRVGQPRFLSFIDLSGNGRPVPPKASSIMTRRGNLLRIPGGRSFERRASALFHKDGIVLRSFSRMAVTLGIAVGLVSGVANSLAAQDQRFQLYAIGGGYFATDLYVGTNINNKVELSDSWTYGGRLVYFSNPRFGVELSYARANSTIKTSVDSVPFGTPQDRGDVGIDQIDISGIYAGYQGPASGYLSIGLGSSILSPHIPGVNTSSSGRFAWNIGLGGMFHFGESLIARIDGRYRGTSTNRSTGSSSWCDGFGYCYGYASWVYWSGEVTAGLGFRF